ncbi:MAG TPA: hypothetical protein VG165_14985 [Solirubrobacteraceae bacterium]|nr:hypothetical protein [Solirubrobacteraceae bacterium]
MLDDDQLRLDIARGAHARVADASTELRAPGQTAKVERVIAGRNSIDDASGRDA